MSVGGRSGFRFSLLLPRNVIISLEMAADPQTESSPKLFRELNFFSAFCLVAGSVIGSGVFIVGSEIATQLHDPFWALSVWMFAGFLTLIGGLLLAELGCALPKAGGQYVYLRELIHPLVGFLYGWTLLLVVQTGSIAALSLAFAKFMARVIPIPDSELKFWATGAILSFTAFNALGIKKGAGLLDFLTSLKLLVLAGISLIGLSLLFGGTQTVSLPTEPLNLSSFGVALIAAFWAYDGWNNVTFTAGEIKNPKKNLPLALGFGLLAVTGLYLLVNYTYYLLLDSSAIANSTFVGADAAGAWGGPLAVKIIPWIVAVSTLGCMNAMILAGPRIPYAMALDGSLPRILCRLNPKTHSPNVAMYFQAAWTCVLVWTGTFDQLFTYAIFAAFIFYGLTAIAMIRLRQQKRPLAEDAFQAPLYPFLPLVYLLFVALFSLNALIEKPWESLAGVVIILTGIPTYFFLQKFQKLS